MRRCHKVVIQKAKLFSFQGQGKEGTLSERRDVIKFNDHFSISISIFYLVLLLFKDEF